MSRPGVLEASLRAPVSGFLERRGYRVWVDPDGRDYLDLVAVRGSEVGLVELKVHDWRTVRAQAVARRALADWVAVAMPSEGLVGRLEASLRGPVAPKIGIWLVEGDSVVERRVPVPLPGPPDGSRAAEARAGFRALVAAALAGELPPGVAWGAMACRTGGGRSYRLDEFPPTGPP